MPINRVLEAIEEIKKGNMVIMIDNEDRENEGDVVYASIFSTPEKVNFMATHCKGLICTSITKETASKLELEPMVKNNDSQHETAFTISVDPKAGTTGISAFERDMTIKILANPLSRADELVRPGHIFPLIAKDGGVLVRTGHTEGSIDLCKLSGVMQSAVICEVMKDNGEMARRDDLIEFAKIHNLKIVYISDIVEFRLRNESLIKEIESKEMNLFNHNVKQIDFSDHLGHIHTVFIFKEIFESSYVKFHNISIDIELFKNSKKLNSLLNSIEFLAQNGGILIFLDNKTKDETKIRNFGIGAQIIKYLNITDIKLLTSHGHREFIGINGFGLNIIEEREI